MITFDDLAAAVVSVLNANSAFVAAIPGKAWLNRSPPNPPGYPYAVFNIDTAGTAQYQSDLSYLQSFTLRMAAYANQGIDVPQAVQLAMLGALNPNPTAWSPLRAGSVILVLPKPYDGRFAPQLRNARHVFLIGAQWEITVSGNISP